MGMDTMTEHNQPQPLPADQLPEVPDCCNDNECLPVLRGGRWTLEYPDGDESPDAEDLRAMADWLDKANGAAPQKSEAEVIGEAAIEHGRLCDQLRNVLYDRNNIAEFSRANTAALAARDRLYELVEKALKNHA